MSDPLSDTMRMIDDWERDAARKAERFQNMADQVERISITESVANGAVSATVGHNGIPTDVSMTDAVRDMPPNEIAANVMAAIRKAQSRYPAALAEIVAETVGEDDPAARHIVTTAEQNFPPPPPEEPGLPEGEPMVFSDMDDDEPATPPRPPRPPRPERRTDRGDEDPGDNDVQIFRE
jgi:DNA-binding protein YbaB